MSYTPTHARTFCNCRKQKSISSSVFLRIQKLNMYSLCPHFQAKLKPVLVLPSFNFMFHFIDLYTLNRYICICVLNPLL